jgi:outer membrane protein insertion porin family
LRAISKFLPGLLLSAACALSSSTAFAQTRPTTKPTTTTAPTSRPANRPVRDLTLAPELRGRMVEQIRILGNHQVSSNVILNVVRTREGQQFDPDTVEEDYQRIFDLKRFANVEAKVEPTTTGVVVVFIVNEQRQIKSIGYKGNKNIATDAIQEAADIKVGQAIDRFRISLAKQSIETLYRTKNFAYAHVNVPDQPLSKSGELIFEITEGPEVTVRKVDFIGYKSFTDDKLLDQVKTRSWIWIFRAGTLDLDQVEDDVASLRKFYTDKGFFDVRVGRKIIVSPDQSEVQVTFLIDEGQRYLIDRVSFRGNASVPDA